MYYNGYGVHVEGAFSLNFQTVFLTKDYLGCTMSEFVWAKMMQKDEKAKKK